MLVFNASEFNYPYENIRFPGQHSEERMLFVTREGEIMLYLRLLLVVVVLVVLVGLNFMIGSALSPYIPAIQPILTLITTFALILFGVIGLWWVYAVWKKSVFIITTRRLTKFIYINPFNRYQLSLGLDKIVDTGAYKKSYFQALTGLGYFVARSSAGNIKNFKIINISFAEDLHNYVNKLLFSFNKNTAELDNFRPFIPHLKGEARDNYVRQVTPKFGKPVE